MAIIFLPQAGLAETRQRFRCQFQKSQAPARIKGQALGEEWL
jgi:hypothetical protein